MPTTNLAKNLQNKKNKAIKFAMPLLAVLFLVVFTAAANLAVAQTPPQIPNYTIPTGPPDNSGVPGSGGTSNPTSMSQPDYTPIVIAIIVVVVIAALTCVWIRNRRKAITE
jgi:hypothetical protein